MEAHHYSHYKSQNPPNIYIYIYIILQSFKRSLAKLVLGSATFYMVSDREIIIFYRDLNNLSFLDFF